jgi:3-deoxy-D-manno-octulosonate 8-phosphate phosphatase (KDO 8-P phosphatase)
LNILSLFKDIRLFVLDVDGVLTDGTVLVLDDGQMARRMNIKDGYALQLAVKKGFKLLIISGGQSTAVRLRLQKLGITDVFMEVLDKKKVLQDFMAINNITVSETLYMGDDIPDIETMQMAGLACCPADAVAEVKAISHYISPLPGGNGCVRDVIEKVLKLNGQWDQQEPVASK